MSYYLMHREWMNNRAFKKEPYTEREAWCWLVEKTIFLPQYTVNIKGKPIELERGQLSYSIRYLAKAWDWKPKRTLMFLKKLEKWHMIETQKETGQTIITICNYNKYQDAEKIKKQEGNTKGNRRETGGGTNKKECLKKEESSSDKKTYAFEGNVIKLNQDDFEAYRGNCPKLTEEEYRTALTNADMAYHHGESKNWYFRLASQLQKAKPGEVTDGSAWFMG